jgi:hypothetical protein
MVVLCALLPSEKTASYAYVVTAREDLAQKELPFLECKLYIKASVLGDLLGEGFGAAYRSSIATSETKMNIELRIDKPHTAVSL